MLNKNISPLKNVSLTFKITLWYTTFIVLLVGSLVVGALFVRDSVAESSGKKKLIEEVTEISSGSDNFTPYLEGVTFSIYDKDGNLIAGAVPKSFKVNEFSLGIITEYTDDNQNKYMYYDLETNSAKLGNGKYIRGIVQTSEGSSSWYLTFAIILSIPLVIAVIMYGGYRIIRSSLKPVRQMTKTAEDISRSNDLSKRIKLEEGSDEVHRLGVIFNEMLSSLERSSEREKRFSSDVSHELRTPITIIMAESEYGTKYTDTVEEAKESFEVIERQSKRMTTMINEILEMTRLDSKVEIQKEEVMLSDLLKIYLEDYKKLFIIKNIQLHVSIEDGITLLANESLLVRVMDNLLSNALKYAKSEVSVTLAKRNRIILEISDDGVGISDSEKRNIWNRFYKVDKSRTTSEDSSSGLGLSITKKIVQLHDGKIAVLDNKPKGTKFVINL